jgi:hypothetical protein
MLFNSVGGVAGHGKRPPRVAPTVGRTFHSTAQKPPLSGPMPGATQSHGRPFGSIATGGSSGVLGQPGMEQSAMNAQGMMGQMMGGGGGVPNLSLIRRLGYGGAPFIGGGMSAGGY